MQYRVREVARDPNRSGNYKFMTSSFCCSVLNHLAIFDQFPQLMIHVLKVGVGVANPHNKKAIGYGFAQ